MANIEGMDQKTTEAVKKLIEERKVENPALEGFFYNETEDTRKISEDFKRKIAELEKSLPPQKE